MANSNVLIGAVLAGTAVAIAPYAAECFRPARPTGPAAHMLGEPGHQTHYRWLGPEDGRVAVCIHGLTTPSFVWEAFAPVLVSQGYRVLLYDLYGRGLSDAPKGLQTGSYFSGQLDRLLDALSVNERVLLLGYSMGGAIAAHYAATRANRVRKVILIAPAGLGHDLGRVPALAARLPVLGGALMRLAYPRAARHALEADRELPCAVERMINRQIEECRWRGFAPNVWSSIRGILSEDLGPCHRRIADHGTPTLAFWGADDEVIPLAGLERLKDHNPKATNVIIPQAGHSLPYTHVREVKNACLGFLS